MIIKTPIFPFAQESPSGFVVRVDADVRALCFQLAVLLRKW